MGPKTQLWWQANAHLCHNESFFSAYYNILSLLSWFCLFYIVLGIRPGLENGQVRHWWTSRAPQQVVILSVHQLNDGRLWIRWSDSALITNWGNLLKDQQTHWTKMSVQEGAITPASGQPCSCQANLCEGVHPLYVRHMWFCAKMSQSGSKAKNLGKKKEWSKLSL